MASQYETAQDIAILQEQMRQLTARVDRLEEDSKYVSGVLNKSWGGATAVFLLGSIIGAIIAFWGNILKVLGK